MADGGFHRGKQGGGLADDGHRPQAQNLLTGSNKAWRWIPEYQALLEGLSKTIKPGRRLENLSQLWTR